MAPLNIVRDMKFYMFNMPYLSHPSWFRISRGFPSWSLIQVFQRLSEGSNMQVVPKKLAGQAETLGRKVMQVSKFSFVKHLRKEPEEAKSFKKDCYLLLTTDVAVGRKKARLQNLVGKREHEETLLSLLGSLYFEPNQFSEGFGFSNKVEGVQRSLDDVWARSKRSFCECFVSALPQPLPIPLAIHLLPFRKITH